MDRVEVIPVVGDSLGDSLASHDGAPDKVLANHHVSQDVHHRIVVALGCRAGFGEKKFKASPDVLGELNNRGTTNSGQHVCKEEEEEEEEEWKRKESRVFEEKKSKQEKISKLRTFRTPRKR